MTTTPRSFADFKREETLSKGKAKCPVCKLDPELYAQIREAKEQGAINRELIEWLHSEHKVTLKATDFLTHSNGNHDPEMRGRN